MDTSNDKKIDMIYMCIKHPDNYTPNQIELYLPIKQKLNNNFIKFIDSTIYYNTNNDFIYAYKVKEHESKLTDMSEFKQHLNTLQIYGCQ